MREIKFRAWDGQKMYQPDEIVLYLGSAWIENLSLDAKVIHIKDTLPLTPLQFTGLKDKNGKEIYEGDLVKYTTHFYGKEKENITEVKWLENEPTDLFGEPDFCGFLIKWGECEVISNIYENPDLLK